MNHHYESTSNHPAGNNNNNNSSRGNTPLKILAKHNNHLRWSLTPRNLTSQLLLQVSSKNGQCDDGENDEVPPHEHVLDLHSPYYIKDNGKFPSTHHCNHPISPTKFHPPRFNVNPDKLAWKCLDAPGLEDDYYLNVMDWNRQGQLAIALNDNTVHWCCPTIWDEQSDDYSDNNNNGGEMDEYEVITTASNKRRNSTAARQQSPNHQGNTGEWKLPIAATATDSIAAIKWFSSPTSNSSSSLLIGTKNGQLMMQPLDHRLRMSTNNSTTFMIDNSRRTRLGAIEVHSMLNYVCVGGKDRQAVIYDLRRSCTNNNGSDHIVLQGVHDQEICGVTISPNGLFVAMGGNDNLVSVWDVRHSLNPLGVLREHTAAVKALTWLPHGNSKLVTGGGTADRSIRLWDLHQLVYYDDDNNGSHDHNGFATMKSASCLSTGSQVTSLVASDACPGLVYASHGFSDNWAACYSIRQLNSPNPAAEQNNYNYQIERVGPLMTGHTQRVLWMCKSKLSSSSSMGEFGNDEELLATAGGDECIRIWRPLKEQWSRRRGNRPNLKRSFTCMPHINLEDE